MRDKDRSRPNPTPRPEQDGPWARRTAVSLTSPYTWGKTKLAPQNMGPNALFGPIVLRSGSCPWPAPSALRLAELLQRELRLRVLANQVPPRLFDAEQRQVDVVVDHRADEGSRPS